MSYVPPVSDIGFILKHLVGIENLRQLGYDITPDLVDGILAGAAELAGERFAALNAKGDKTGARLCGWRSRHARRI